MVLIIRPRLDVLRVYYNQATPHDKGELKLVNWYDANSLGLFKVPLLPSPKDVYRNFEGRALSIPIIHVNLRAHFQFSIQFPFGFTLAVTTMAFRQICQLFRVQ